MKISLNWLNDYIDLYDFYEKPEELSERLTRAGLEVEGWENQKDAFKNIVTGKIEKLETHPDADKLTVVQVDIGEKEIKQIVCGAKNHKQGDHVVVALVGAILPGEFKINKSKIRGIESFGMLCSEKELGLASESQGILILPQATAVGQSFSDYLGANDIIFELSVTPNRADCLSHFGLARELGCLLGREVKMPEVHFKPTSQSTLKHIRLEVKNSKSNPRYTGRSIFNVKVGPSPVWLKKRLESVDLNSINNVVDVTNFVMMELGQPMHAFDADLIANREIVVSDSEAKERFTTLDGTEIELTGQELMIRDGEKPVALAGVVGGLNSGVSEKTQNVFLESAYFLQKIVRQSARRFGIETDSGYRFSRGTDPEMALLALNRASQLLEEIAGGDVAGDYYDHYPEPISPCTIQISKEFIETKMGYQVAPQEFENWMERLGCQVTGSEQLWTVVPPRFRWDLESDVDLVEEYARLFGYEHIKETLPVLHTMPTQHDPQYQMERTLEARLKEQHFLQAMNYHFVGREFQRQILGTQEQIKNCGLGTTDDPIEVTNPLNEEVNVMRTSLIPWLFKNLLNNYRHGNVYGRIFEFGAVFEKNEKSYLQKTHLGLCAWGETYDLWNKQQKRPVVFELKTAIENLLASFKLKQVNWDQTGEAPEFLHPGQWARLNVEGKSVGFIGTLHPKICSEYKFRHDIALSEINWQELMNSTGRSTKYKKISRFPQVDKDISFVVPIQTQVGLVVKEILKAGKNLIQSVDVFDVFTGGDLKSDERSVSFKMFVQSHDGTLTDVQLQQLQNDVIQTVGSKLGLRVR